MGIGTKIKEVVGAVAPAIATAMGGPFAGVATKFVADKFGITDTGSVEDFLVMASGDPNKLLELKAAEIEFKQYLASLDIQEYQLANADRASARELATNRGVVVQAGLSLAYTIGYFTTLWLMIGGYTEIAEGHSEVVNTLIGALGAVQVQVVNFWFGSSRGSKEKTEALANMKVVNNDGS